MNPEKKIKINPKLKKSVIEWLKFMLGLGVIIGIGYVVLTYVPFFAKHDHYVIVTNSMEPVINVGDLVIVNNQYALDDLQIGDIIAFHVSIDDTGTEVVVVHYVAEINIDDQGLRSWRTHPQVSASLDPWTLYDDDIIGMHVLTIARLGKLLLFLESTIGRIILVIDVVILYFVAQIFTDKDKKKKPTIPEGPSTPDNPEPPKSTNEPS